MSTTFEQKLHNVRHNPALLKALTDLKRGIEKESLRITPQGKLAMSAHPETLGSALCHHKITTDYSEALLEFITPVHSSIDGALSTLSDIHHFTYQQLQKQDELLWANSMPCQLSKADDIPVARYGSSNVAKMKTVYRLGLGHRYGRIMQTISGIHYNFSLSDRFWANYQQILDNQQSLQQFKTEQYFGLIRNFRRFVPLFVYLFGASPALCRSFIQGQEHKLQPFDEHSWYTPHATSLRMGDLGYQSKAQDALFVCYNTLENYIDSLRKGITESHPDYDTLGLKDDNGDYQQLNTALLQIENEFYSTIRPKRVAASGEAPINALARSGVEYIEVRCVDVNPFAAVGIDEETIHFLDIFLLYCLFNDSPLLDELECQQNTLNLQKVVEAGRDPELTLDMGKQQVHFRTWGEKLLKAMQPLAAILDSLHATDAYQASLKKQQAKIQDSKLTPSAQILDIMTREQITFAEFGRRQSQHWQDHFLSKPLSNAKTQRFESLAADSIAQQATIEAADELSFEDYLKDFYQQY